MTRAWCWAGVVALAVAACGEHRAGEEGKSGTSTGTTGGRSADTSKGVASADDSRSAAEAESVAVARLSSVNLWRVDGDTALPLGAPCSEETSLSELLVPAIASPLKSVTSDENASVTVEVVTVAVVDDESSYCGGDTLDVRAVVRRDTLRVSLSRAGGSWVLGGAHDRVDSAGRPRSEYVGFIGFVDSAGPASRRVKRVVHFSPKSASWKAIAARVDSIRSALRH